MINQATEKAKKYQNVEFLTAFSDNIPLKSDIADIITCSQSFHWMEPESTMCEVFRLLAPGGVFAVYDYDWPPVCNGEMDLAYQKLDDFIDRIDIDISGSVRYPKAKHLDNFRKSNLFRYSREIVFSSTENCDAKRYYNFILSQGGTQVIINKDPSLIEMELADFKTEVDKYFGDRILPVDFCYRMRLGIK